MLRAVDARDRVDTDRPWKGALGDRAEADRPRKGELEDHGTASALDCHLVPAEGGEM